MWCSRHLLKRVEEEETQEQDLALDQVLDDIVNVAKTANYYVRLPSMVSIYVSDAL